jgi:hypothetical protein
MSLLLADFVAKVFLHLAIKNSFGRRRDFHVKMWGTSSPEDKLTGDLGNVIEATSIGGRRSDFFPAGKLAPGNLGLLQQYRHKAGQSLCDGCPQLVELTHERSGGIRVLTQTGPKPQRNLAAQQALTRSWPMRYAAAKSLAGAVRCSLII